MIGSLIALLSLDMTRKLVAAGLVASSIVISGATVTSPVVVTTPVPHGVIRPVHAVVAIPGVTLSRYDADGNVVTDTLWVCTPTDATHLTLSTYTNAGQPVPSIGSGVYTSGGTVKTAFPDGSILLGRRNLAMQMATTTPRIVFVPRGSPAWDLAPYGGAIPAATLPRRLSAETAEQRTMKLQRQCATERHRFEVHVTGCATPPDPDFGDFDVTQAIYHALFVSMFNMIGPDRAKFISGNWSSQGDDVQLLDSRGQKWVAVCEISQPVLDESLAFVPNPTVGQLTVNFTGGASADQVVVVVP